MKLTIRKAKERGQVRWLLDYTPEGGKRVRRFFKTKAEAEKARDEQDKVARKAGEAWIALTNAQRSDLILGYQELRAMDMTLAQLLEAYRSGKSNGNGVQSVSLVKAGESFEEFMRRKGNSEKHCANQGRWVRRFAKGREELPVSKVTTEDLIKYLDQYEGVTWNSNRDSARNFFGYCHRQGWMEKFIADRYTVPKKRINYVHREIWTVEQLEKALTFCASLDTKPMLYVALATFCGIRPTEIDRMTHDMIRLDEHTIDLPPHVTKTKQPRTIHLHPTAHAWIKLALELGSPLGAEFAPSESVKQNNLLALRNYIGFKAWPHDIMRHSFASYYSELTKSIGATALEMGNSEGIIKKNYKSKVTPKECKAFWALTPEAIHASLQDPDLAAMDREENEKKPQRKTK